MNSMVMAAELLTNFRGKKLDIVLLSFQILKNEKQLNTIKPSIAETIKRLLPTALYCIVIVIYNDPRMKKNKGTVA